MKISLSTGMLTKRLGEDNLAKMAKNAGFEAVDWSLEALFPSADLYKGDYPQTIFSKPLDEIIEFLRPSVDAFVNAGLSIGQAHAPAPSIISFRPEIKEYTTDILIKTIGVCKYYKVPYLVVHGCSLLEKEKTLNYDDIEKLNRDYFKQFIPYLKESGVTMCIENMVTYKNDVPKEGHLANPLDAKQFVDDMNAFAGQEVFGFCMDVGHLNLTGCPCRKFMKIMGNRIKCLHLHDNNGRHDKHMIPYTGTVDWENFILGCKESGFAGNISFENGAHYKNEYMPQELIEDFVRLNGAIGRYLKKAIQNNND